VFRSKAYDSPRLLQSDFFGQSTHMSRCHSERSEESRSDSSFRDPP
jgi:hypothetical protein